MLRRWFSATIRFGRDCIERFFSVQGLDRAMALAAQAFTTLLPLLVVYGALVPAPDGNNFADRVVKQLDLKGASATSVHQAFASKSDTVGSVTAIGIVLLVISGLSFTRALQRLFEGTYRMDKLGLRGTVPGLQWLAFLAVLLTVRPLLFGFLHGVAALVMELALSAMLWLATPFLLLARRIDWRRLVPGALLTMAGMAGLSVAGAIYLPHTITTLSKQFGFIGISFALVSWLFAAGGVLVVTASIAAVIDDRRRA
jgi:membrane protein